MSLSNWIPKEVMLKSYLEVLDYMSYMYQPLYNIIPLLLQRKIPFSIDLSKTVAEYYKMEGLVIVVLPVISTLDNTPVQEKKQQVRVVTQDDRNKLANYQFDSEKEVELEVVKKTKPVDTNQEESSYSKLYNDILSQKNPVNLGGQTKEAPKNEKVKRNETCPCGSGKKYKKCHGK
jgi:hypothetical protein